MGQVCGTNGRVAGARMVLAILTLCFLVVFKMGTEHKTAPTRSALKVCPVQRRVELKTACLAHQSITSTPPTYLSADIQLVSEHGRRHLRSSSYRTLAVPRTRTTLGDRSFAVAGPRVWNSLPATIRQITSYGQFRQHLETGAGNRSALRATLDCCALYKYSY